MEETTIVEQVETTDSTADTTAEAPSGAVERTFTQAEVNALLAKESSKLKRKLKKQQQERPQAQQPQQPPQAQNVAMEALSKIMNRLESLETASQQQSKEQSFNALLGDRQVDDGVRELLFDSYNPNDPAKTTSLLDKFAAAGNPLPEPTGYQSPGAPAQTKQSLRGPNPMNWSKDDVQVLRQEGRFIEQLEKWRSTLPGGGGNLFANRRNKNKK